MQGAAEVPGARGGWPSKARAQGGPASAKSHISCQKPNRLSRNPTAEEKATGFPSNSFGDEYLWVPREGRRVERCDSVSSRMLQRKAAHLLGCMSAASNSNTLICHSSSVVYISLSQLVREAIGSDKLNQILSNM